ncbi:MAG: PaaI family thioesterase [Actinomycetota bacterium]|nr:PaaI family thioesterase [Actinomycetota bacterium]
MAPDPTTMSLLLHDVLGLEVAELGPDRVVITWTVAEQNLQPHGLAHGGMHSLVNESAASIAGAAWLGAEGSCVGINNNTDFLRAARFGDELTATATPIHRGRSQQLWLVETLDARGRLVARGQVRLQNLPART